MCGSVGCEGRRSAVVVSEVRSLAEKSAGSTHETCQLIKRARNAPQLGADIVDQVTHTSEEIAHRIAPLSQTNVEIGEASAVLEWTITCVAAAVDLAGMAQQNSVRG